MDDVFLFSETPPPADEDCVLIEVPCDCETREQLFDAFRSTLGLPEYFGGNWDAFSDSLRDLSWVPERTIVLLHRGRPLRDDNQFRIYLLVLKNCVQDWKEGEEHRLIAVFPATLRDVVRLLMG